MWDIQWFRLFLSVFLAGFCSGQLNINVRLREHDIVKETFTSNVSENTVILELTKLDGTVITHLQDFRDEIQVIRVVLLGDPDLGEEPTLVHSICFLYQLQVRPSNEIDGDEASDLVAPDAMIKLRQKNPGVIRTAEEDKGLQHIRFDAAIDVQKSSVISPAVYRLCKDSGKVVYSKSEDLKHFTSSKDDVTAAKILESSQLITNLEEHPKCSAVDVTNIQQQCICELTQCIPWYPCGLKFCKNNELPGKPTTYRCGIKTCKKCYSYEYLSASRMLCLWN